MLDNDSNASNNVTSSPWKKPKLVLLNKSKSLKRKCKSFALDHGNESSDKNQSTTSTLFQSKTNIFSISSNATLNKPQNDNDDMKYFFVNSSSTVTLDEHQDVNDLSKSLFNANNLFSSLQTSILSNITLNTDQKHKELKPAFESDRVPIDWSLKTRLRFMSFEKFSSCNNIKSIHESQAVSNFARFNDFYINLNDKTSENMDDVFKTLYCEAMSYWTFPNIPWLKLYPRENCLNIANATTLPLEAQKALHNQWTLSFKSLYNLVKSNECAYFYMLTQTFMVLFRAENINDQNTIHALLTPSTKGMRKTLKDEEIEFTLPLLESETTNKNQDEEEDVCGDGVDARKDDDGKKSEQDDDANDWLEEIGLDTKQIKVTQSTRHQIQESVETLDNKPNSTLLIRGGADVQALFNFLLNSKICFSSSGPMCGVPPTLLAPNCFLGASLNKLKFQQTLMKTLNNDGQSLTKYAIDLTGPILPCALHRLCKLFSQTQHGQFEMVSNSLLSSLAFNCCKFEDDVCLRYLGNNLDESEKTSLNAKYGLNGTSTCINSIVCENNTYRCYY